ncbi:MULTISPECIES: hypothetical protein [Acinetobacter]|uniref:hypothetical protein n=1 Tax=Acinetobacter TaxID=469 RepID=UPI000536506D|nr:hypothetical protein [Acinetobacter sp. HR7]KGT46484.1 hypothetical protein GW12_25410 [Acinetobacter sp. HR7]
MKKIAFILAIVVMQMSSVQASSEENTPDLTRLCEGKGPHVKLTTKIEGRKVKGSCQIGFKPDQANVLDYKAMNQPAVQNVCKGKARGTSAVVNIKGKNIPGKCDLVFKENRR